VVNYEMELPGCFNSIMVPLVAILKPARSCYMKLRDADVEFRMISTVKLTPSSPVVIICTTSLTFSNSEFCPYSVFMCFVWI